MPPVPYITLEYSEDIPMWFVEFPPLSELGYGSKTIIVYIGEK
jgi:hypothetical protein